MECPDGPGPFNSLVTERKRINISLGQDHECILLFIPYECKLLLSYLMGIEKNAFPRSIASCHLPESLINCSSCNWLYYVVKFALVHCYFPWSNWFLLDHYPCILEVFEGDTNLPFPQRYGHCFTFTVLASVGVVPGVSIWPFFFFFFTTIALYNF